MTPIRLDDFIGGEDTSSSLLSMPPNASRRMLGIHPVDSRTGMKKMRGPLVALTSGFDIYAFIRWKTATNPNSYIYSHLNGANHILNSNTFGIIYTGVAGLNFTTDCSMVQVSTGGVEKLYVASPGGQLLVWWEALAAATPANWVAPLVVAVVAAGGAGVLNPGMSETPYYEYVYTYNLASGNETSASGVSARIVPINTSVNVTVTWDATAGIPVISSANVYRRGSRASDFYYVGTVANGGGATAIFNDNVSDLDQSSTRISPRNNGVLPSGVKRIKLHNTRLWGFTGTGNILYFSGLNQYGVWGATSEGFDLEGGNLTLEGPGDDSVLTVESMGDILIIGRTNSVYMLIGNDFNQFVLSKRSGIGLISEFAMARVYNSIYYLGVDFRVYRLADGEPVWVSQQIQSELDQVYLTGFGASTLLYPEVSFSDGTLWVNMPTDPATGTSKTFGYRVADNYWYEASGFGTPPLTFRQYGTGLKTARGTMTDVGGRPAGPDEATNISFNRRDIVLRQHYDGISAPVSWKSRELTDTSEPSLGKSFYRVDHIYIDGDATIDMTDSGRIKLGVYCDGVRTQFEIGSGGGASTVVSGTLYNSRLPGTLVGRTLNVAIEGNAKELAVRSVSIRVVKVRDTNV